VFVCVCLSYIPTCSHFKREKTIRIKWIQNEFPPRIKYQKIRMNVCEPTWGVNGYIHTCSSLKREKTIQIEWIQNEFPNYASRTKENVRISHISPMNHISDGISLCIRESVDFQHIFSDLKNISY